MTMLDVFQDFVAFFEQPPPAFVGDTPILGFGITTPDDPWIYDGFAVLQAFPQRLNPFQLEGFGCMV